MKGCPGTLGLPERAPFGETTRSPETLAPVKAHLLAAGNRYPPGQMAPTEGPYLMRTGTVPAFLPRLDRLLFRWQAGLDCAGSRTSRRGIRAEAHAADKTGVIQ